jgi:uncharacterized protein YuzE
MKIIYDRERDGLRILFNDSPIERSDAIDPGLILDYDTSGDLVGLELAEASRRMRDPYVVEYEETVAATEETAPG